MTNNGITAFNNLISMLLDFMNNVTVPGTNISFWHLFIGFFALSALAGAIGHITNIGSGLRYERSTEGRYATWLSKRIKERNK